MDITVDGKTHFLLHAAPGSVGSALVEINEFLQANGRALQSIIADGQNVPAEHITQAFAVTPVTSIKTLQVTSADQRDLARESIEELAEVVPELPVACQQLSTLLAGEAQDEALDGFDNLIQIWSALKQRQSQIVDALSLDANELSLENAPLAQHDQALAKHLETARTMRAAQNYTALADHIAYELAPCAEREPAIIDLLKAQL